MIKKILAIFTRDLRVNLKDFLTLYIIVVPLIFGLLINIFTPGINDTTIKIALLEGENSGQENYFRRFSHVELLEDIEGIESRVMERDHIVGIVREGEDYYIIAQGNEPKQVIDFAKTLNSFYALGLDVEDSNTNIVEMGRSIPPLKKTMVNTSILFISILGGMLIAMNIVEEKVDNTISAINLTTISKNQYILGKSAIGVIFSIFGSLVLLLITGFRDVNFFQLITIVFVTTILSILIGFLQGLNNKDIIGAAGSIKLLFIPLMAAVVTIELLGEKWQKFFYWNPFYFAYRGNGLVLGKGGTWTEILINAALVLMISLLVYIALIPRIKKGLERS